MTVYSLFCVSNKSFSKGAKKGEEEVKAPEPDMIVAEEGNIFYKSEKINSNWSTHAL